MPKRKIVIFEHGEGCNGKMDVFYGLAPRVLDNGQIAPSPTTVPVLAAICRDCQHYNVDSVNTFYEERRPAAIFTKKEIQ